MGLSHSPNIIKTGIVLYLDAANEKSYPGTGTTWTNMGSAAIDGTTDTGNSFVGTAPQSFSFDGTSAADIRIGTGETFFPLYSFTLEAWVKSSGMGAAQTLGGIFGLTYGIRLHFSTSGVVVFGVDNGTDLTTISSGGNYQDGVWHHIVATKNNSGSTDNGNLYIDGDLKVSESRTWTGETRWPTNEANIGRDNNDAPYYLDGNIALAKIYNIELSEAQVIQNFNATRGRFGV